MGKEVDNILEICKQKDIVPEALESDLGLYSGYLNVRKEESWPMSLNIVKQCAEYLGIEVSDIIKEHKEKEGNQKAMSTNEILKKILEEIAEVKQRITYAGNDEASVFGLSQAEVIVKKYITEEEN